MASSSKDDSGGDGDKPSCEGEKPSGDGGTSAGDTAPAPSDPFLFSAGDRVLAYDGPLLYEAKVRRVKSGRNNEWSYLIHYVGWNKRRDKWVGADKVMEITEDNVSKQEALQKEYGVDKSSKSGLSAQPKPKSSTVAKGKQSKGDSSIENDLYEGKLDEMQIPSMLKKQLVDDWEFVNQLDKLVKLRRSPNIDEILTKYKEYVSEKDPVKTASVGEILNGIRSYFENSLPQILLYEKERPQFCDAVPHGVSPSSIYGAEHLLRLFVKLPKLLQDLEMEKDTSTRLRQILLDFLKMPNDD